MSRFLQLVKNQPIFSALAVKRKIYLVNIGYNQTKWFMFFGKVGKLNYSNYINHLRFRSREALILAFI